MIFNDSYKLGEVLADLSQEEILNTPEFFAMSFEEIIAHQRCPVHLAEVLLKFPWVNRPNFVQVRPQDFRGGSIPVLGTGWHVDVNTHLANGQEDVAKDLSEFRSMVASWGNVVETEFVKNPFEVDVSKVDPFNHPVFAGYVASLNPEAIALKPQQVGIYTSRDVHRVSPNVRPGNARLIIVTVECDEYLPEGSGRVGLSLRERA